ncbi:pyruvate kinase PKM [Drosophila tropicalis]|uniref:pyruvate kinase PKM n=1 Tax=Drosophila tropicalis TaxID=46794 RepID=UPI0035ABA8B7
MATIEEAQDKHDEDMKLEKVDSERQNPETLDKIITNICSRLKVIAVDVDKVQRAKELLASMQRRKTFFALLGHDDDVSIDKSQTDLQRLESKFDLGYMDEDMPADYMEEDFSEELSLLAFDEDHWHSYFKGFQIISATHDAYTNENNKCVELSTIYPCDRNLKSFLHSGVRCFLLDLFIGTQADNQALIVQLREAEISVSKEYGFPVVSTICVKLSPRFQYTGYLCPDLLKDNPNGVELKKGDSLILTVNREYSNASTASTIYVNARFLLCDVKQYDFILIDEQIQLMVLSRERDHLKCCVARGGLLRSYMPVLFPARCSKFRVSYEELEDLTFAREVGINVVISNMTGTVRYLDDLEHVMCDLQCDYLKIFARVVLNEIQGCDCEMNWAIKRYDGFLIELAEPSLVPDIMHLCPNAEIFMQLAYATKKPMIFDAIHINEQKIRVDPSHYYYTFYYPDKYLVKCYQAQDDCYFSMLQESLFKHITPKALGRQPYCDNSHTGADSLAMMIVTASVECEAVAIVVCGVTTRMVQKIAHFRPFAPIIFVSQMRSAEDYVSLHHNVTMLSFRTTYFISHRRNTFRKAIYGLAYLADRKIVKQNDLILLVYNYEPGTTFPEKYLMYKFDKINFPKHMCKSMFPPNDSNGILIDNNDFD